MNPYILFAGSALMVFFGMIFQDRSTISVGIGLMWVGLALM